MKNFVKQHGIEKFFYLDSDVLLYMEINPQLKTFSSDCGRIFSGSLSTTSLHTSYFTKDSLSNFCDFILDTYKNHHERLDNYIEETGESISDMSLAYLYFDKLNMKNASNLTTPTLENGEDYPGFFDITIGETTDVCQTKKLGYFVKKIRWTKESKGIPVVQSNSDGEIFQLRSLHFQGDRKKLLPLYMSVPFREIYFLHTFFYKIKRFLIKLGYIAYKKRFWKP